MHIGLSLKYQSIYYAIIETATGILYSRSVVEETSGVETEGKSTVSVHVIWLAALSTYGKN